MGNDRRAVLFNLLTYVTLGATVCLVVLYMLIGFNLYNPFPPPRIASVTLLPTETPTPSGPTDIPTWTPTNTPTITPTPGPTNTRTPTLTPSVTPTFPPTATRTPKATRSLWPFTCEVELRRPEYDNWSGVAGHVQDLDGNPLAGYHVQVQCPGISQAFTPRAGADQRHNQIYGSEAAWEQFCDPSQYQPMEIRVQLFNTIPEPDGDFRTVSEQVVVRLGGYASASLGYVTCTLNWEEY